MFKRLTCMIKATGCFVVLMICIIFFYGLFIPSITVAEENKKESDFPTAGGIQIKKKEYKTKKKADYYKEILNQTNQASLYLIGPEDVLNISVWKNEDLNHDVVVRPDGKISFPLIGDIQAGGKTPEELRQEITNKLDKFIPDPVVTVMVLKINSIKVFILGNIPNPGMFIVGRRINVLQAIATAGGLNEFASSKDIIVIRTIDKRQIKIPFNYKEITEGKNTEQNIYLQAGDVIVVP